MSNCPDCDAKIGELHSDYCDVERCPDCGGQMISCDCEGDIVHPRLPWSGVWPGVEACQEFGWYAKFNNGWVKCDKDDPDASEDLNRLCYDAVWDAENARWRKR